jgi:hypothetical protein
MSRNFAGILALKPDLSRLSISCCLVLGLFFALSGKESITRSISTSRVDLEDMVAAVETERLAASSCSNKALPFTGGLDSSDVGVSLLGLRAEVADPGKAPARTASAAKVAKPISGFLVTFLILRIPQKSTFSQL